MTAFENKIALEDALARGDSSAWEIEVHEAGETKRAKLYKKNSGKYVYWNPFNGQRVEIRRSKYRMIALADCKRLRANLAKPQRCPYASKP